jgi:hypothetical protein
MKIDTTKVSYEGQVKEFGNAKLTIRPYPQSRSDVGFKNGTMIISGINTRDMFMYCLTEWDGVSGSDDKPLKMTDDIKKMIYDFRLGSITNEKDEVTTMSDFVIAEARKLTDEIANDTKN